MTLHHTLSSGVQPLVRAALICDAQFVLQLDFSIVNVAASVPSQRDLWFRLPPTYSGW